ncbi:hypothetical protein FA95DRAFT_1567047, partial [Auriscalpium vulgare]
MVKVYKSVYVLNFLRESKIKLQRLPSFSLRVRPSASHVHYNQDKHSMLNLTRVIDRTTGYVFVRPADAAAPAGIANNLNAPSSQRPNIYGPFSSAADVQGRWVDSREDWESGMRL